MKIEIVIAGDGNTYPQKGNVVTIHYSGWLHNGGAKFDSTRERNKPLTFKIGNEEVIQGLDMAVSQLSEKERATVTIPAHLAYGERGFPAL